MEEQEKTQQETLDASKTSSLDDARFPHGFEASLVLEDGTIDFK